MSLEEFKKIIETIGFEYDTIGYYYEYKEYCIVLYKDQYSFYNGSKWIYNITDLIPFEKEFKREIRSIKLKQLLR